MRKRLVKLFPERKELLVNSMSLPKDILYGASILTVTGNQEFWNTQITGFVCRQNTAAFVSWEKICIFSIIPMRT